MFILLIQFYWLGSGNNLNNFFKGGSRNWFSILAIFITATAYISKLKNDISQIPPILPSLFCFFICLLAAGRAGIGASIIILGGVLFCQEKKFFFFLTLVICSFLLLFVAYLYFEILNYSLNMNINKFTISGITNDPRISMIAHFIENFSIKQLFFGMDINLDPFWRKWSLNPHNSFILLQINYGISSFFVVFSIIMSIVLLIIYKSPLFFIFLALLLRASTDAFLFNGYFDFVMYFFVFFWVFISKNHLKEE
jgi:hypothetical protein